MEPEVRHGMLQLSVPLLQNLTLAMEAVVHTQRPRLLTVSAERLGL